MLLGEDTINMLQNSTVAVFGCGGVGSYAIEALCRCGVGNLVLIDNDLVDASNINRQLIATQKTLGLAKVLAAKMRCEEINPEIKIKPLKLFYSSDSDSEFLDGCDYVVDAIDTISAKLHLVEICKQKKIPIISAMGAGNKTDPTMFEVSDIYKTSVCPLCRVMRRELKALDIKNLKVVFSKELPLVPQESTEQNNKRSAPGSLPFVPGAMGLIIAREVVFDLKGLKLC
ncbi:MAG: tRNA threonylcarbamoyladenosine dehydratase [Oscillospiraceae bacterium]